jgi:hypothetical protein
MAVVVSLVAGVGLGVVGAEGVGDAVVGGVYWPSVQWA